MEHEGASNGKLHIDKIARAFTHRTIDERLLAAAKNDDGDMLEEIFEDPESFDINHQDGFVDRLQPDYRTVSSIRNSKTWQYRCLDSHLPGSGHPS